MPTDHCYRPRKEASLEERMIFAIRERFPKACLKGSNHNPAKWRIEQGPIKDMEWQDSIERAWALAWRSVIGTGDAGVSLEALIDKMRKGARK